MCIKEEKTNLQSNKLTINLKHQEMDCKYYVHTHTHTQSNELSNCFF